MAPFEGYKLEIRPTEPGPYARSLIAYDVFLDGKPVKGLRHVRIDWPLEDVVTCEMEFLPGECTVAVQDAKLQIEYNPNTD
jgi:hypothetical protein